jgi:hypothetical protein
MKEINEIHKIIDETYDDVMGIDYHIHQPFGDWRKRIFLKKIKKRI